MTAPFEELIAELADGNDDWLQAVQAFAERIWARGDTLVIYRNEELGHPESGHVQVTSYGSPASQLEAEQYPDGPPSTMPDIGNAINWRYQLYASYGPETA